MKDEKPYLQLTVHQLVDFLLRRGDIDDRIYNQEAMQLGSKLHSGFQKKQGNDYLSEYLLGEVFSREKGTISLQGRADGIITGGDYPIVDEIKSTLAPLKVFHKQQGPWHLGQAECYALMYAHQQKLSKIGVRLTYLSQTSDDKETYDYVYALEELETKVNSYIDEYLEFLGVYFEHLSKRDKSLKDLPFPFKGFRVGQRELAKYAYGIAQKGGYLFAEAPTGIGKTMSLLYPSIKALKKGRLEKIFYLTAKNSGAEASSSALQILYKKGLVAHDSSILAKDKICFFPGHNCNPSDCPFAKGYYDKIKEVTLESLRNQVSFSSDYVIATAKERKMCPFELQLDLSLYSDIITCDYNYFFDPLVYLERFFGDMADSSKDLVLVDEAHNLLERGRMMYSASLSSKEAFYAKKKLPRGKYQGLKRALGKVIKAFAALGSELPEGESDLETFDLDLTKALESFKRAHQKASKEGLGRTNQDYRDFFLESNKYLKLLENYFSSSSRLYVSKIGTDVTYNLFCLDPSKYLKANLNEVKGAILFSATLSPIDYYMDCLLGSHDFPYLLLPSPFPKENFELMLAPKVSVRYKDREGSYEEVAKYLSNFIEAKKGNYFIYFPSYEYLNKITPYLSFPKADVLVQDQGLDAEGREEFLSHFVSKPKKSMVGLLVIGGAFSEGIDLTSDRLIGVAIVGIGLPQIGHENNLIKDYQNGVNQKGFEYAYMDPGMNKVMQAVGRLIRSETDIGAALLIDDRYMKEEYRCLFSRTWNDYEVVTCPEDVKENLSLFYKKKSR